MLNFSRTYTVFFKAYNYNSLKDTETLCASTEVTLPLLLADISDFCENPWLIMDSIVFVKFHDSFGVFHIEEIKRPCNRRLEKLS